MTPRRPSPILLPGGDSPEEESRFRAWFRRVFRRTPSASPDTASNAPGEKEKEEDDPDNSQAPTPQRSTIQLLPGRLEPLIPEVIQQEVRFQRTSAGEQEVTLGWELGDPPNHVTLDHPSIQPLHAKMTFQKGSWMIESLVPHDPVEVNGTPVPSTTGPYLLAHGDQIRIGEALFRFHLP